MFDIINKFPKGKKVLLSPLDWGLGHATRCIPLIRLMLKQENEVFVCCEGFVQKLIESEFPEVHLIPFKGYGISYSGKRNLLIWSVFIQLPKIAYRAYRERKELQKIVNKIKPELIISDNRLGFRHSKIKSIYITHQLRIKTGWKFLDNWARYCHYHFINKFSECWVPDFKGPNSLAGELSNPQKPPRIPVVYLGPLSRFVSSPSPLIHKAVIVLSGPEPQRSIFENMILQQASTIRQKIILVRGLPGEHQEIHHPQVVIYPHLPADQLSRIMQESEIIIARSGYSTIMDLVAMRLTAILVPTPGQTEQEYLAQYLSEKKMFTTVSQEQFDLKQILEHKNSYS